MPRDVREVTALPSRNQLEVEPAAVVGEGHRLPPVAALRDVVGDAREHDTGEARHASGAAPAVEEG